MDPLKIALLERAANEASTYGLGLLIIGAVVLPVILATGALLWRKHNEWIQEEGLVPTLASVMTGIAVFSIVVSVLGIHYYLYPLSSLPKWASSL